jgi:hypothetical protein
MFANVRRWLAVHQRAILKERDVLSAAEAWGDDLVWQIPSPGFQ